MVDFGALYSETVLNEHSLLLEEFRNGKIPGLADRA
jgi:hypothetical protein